MEIDYDNLARFGLLIACSALGVSAIGSAIYIFHYASEQTKPTGKNSQLHFVLSWVMIISVALFGILALFYVTKLHRPRSEHSEMVKSLRVAAKKPLFGR